MNTCDKEDNIINHVSISDIVQECSQRTAGMVAQVLELHHKLLADFLVDDADLQGALVGKEVSVVGRLKQYYHFKIRTVGIHV